MRPILGGFHPDPSVCRVGAWCYLATSSFEYAPGIPLHRSRDLRTWEAIGHVRPRGAGAAPPSGGLYAPTLRHHAGRFWLATTDVSDGRGHLIASAPDAAGPWSEPVRLPALAGIDPDLAWGVDGTCYLTYAGYRDGRPIGIVQAIVDPERGHVLREPRLLWAGTGAQYPEGPHLHARDGAWYLVIAEGGTERGHMISIARGPSPEGPFEPHPRNPILSHRSTNHPVQGTGHGDLVECADGHWALVFLGVRPRGGNAGWSPLGREVFAREVSWEGGWPRPGAPIEPAETTLVTDDGVPGPPAPAWIGPNGAPAERVELVPDGWRLAARAPDPASVDFALVARRQAHHQIAVRAELDVAGGEGGLSLRIDPAHRYDLELVPGCARVLARLGPVTEVIAEHPRAGSAAVLELATEPAAPGPRQLFPGSDVVVLRVDGRELARLDGRYLSPEVAGGFTGRVVGVYARAGAVVLRRWSYRGRDED